MTEYRVMWVIEIDAPSPEHAARQAWAIQKDPVSTATVFDVDGTMHDVVNEIPTLSRAEWMFAVRMEDTLLGYDDWVAHRLRQFSDAEEMCNDLRV